MPECRIVCMLDSLKSQTYLDLEQSIRKLEVGQKSSVVFLGKVGLGISRENLAGGNFERYFLILDDEDDYDGEFRISPKGRCVSVRFRGSHTEASIYYQKLMSYTQKQGLSINGLSREITLINYGRV